MIQSGEGSFPDSKVTFKWVTSYSPRDLATLWAITVSLDGEIVGSKTGNIPEIKQDDTEKIIYNAAVDLYKAWRITPYELT